MDIFGDAYAALIVTPKMEPEEEKTPTATNNTQQINLQISDVHTIGTIIKDEPLDNTQIITIDPHCKLHGINANTDVDTIQEATACKPITAAGNCDTSPVLSEFPLPEATSTHMESLQEPTSSSVNTSGNTDEASFGISQLSESTLPEATSLHEATDTETSNVSSLMANSTPSVSVPGLTIVSSLSVSDLDYNEQSNSANLISMEKDPPVHLTVKTPPCSKNKDITKTWQ